MNNAADRPPSFFSRWGEALAFVGLAALSKAMYVGLAWLVITSSLTAYAQHDFVNLGIASIRPTKAIHWRPCYFNIHSLNK